MPLPGSPCIFAGMVPVSTLAGNGFWERGVHGKETGEINEVIVRLDKAKVSEVLRQWP